MNKIPKVLETISGEQVTTKEQWELFRRKEILNLFSEFVYGVRDIEKPDNLYYKIISDEIFLEMRRKEVKIGFNDFEFPVTLYMPEKHQKPLPAFVYVMHEFQEDAFKIDEDGNFGGAGSVIPLKEITDRGYAIAIMPTRNIYRDWEAHKNYEQGVFTAYAPLKKRAKNSWATISAWAWGASRVLDYLETDKDIDSASIAVAGHSRGGKTALWAGATDERFKYVISNNSGCMGAAVLRNKKGEHIKNINVTDWFCGNFHDFNDCEEMLPVDQHMLVSLIAPRYVYVSSSSEDEWADPANEYLACHLADEVFRLYGNDGFCAPKGNPEMEIPQHKGHIAYHMKQGEHSITSYDWKNFMDYFDSISEI